MKATETLIDPLIILLFIDSFQVCYFRARAERVYCKELGATKLQYPEFLLALHKIGVKRQTGLDEVITKVLKHGRCRREHTMADFIVFDALSEPGSIKNPSATCLVSSTSTMVVVHSILTNDLQKLQNLCKVNGKHTPNIFNFRILPCANVGHEVKAQKAMEQWATNSPAPPGEGRKDTHR